MQRHYQDNHRPARLAVQTATNNLKRYVVATPAILLLVLQASFAGDVDFDHHVRPILSDKCFRCHGPDAKARQADLRLDTSEGLFADLGGRAAVVPGKPLQSELIRRITSPDQDNRMPPQESKLELSSAEIDTLRQWIEAGAAWDSHWAFQPVVQPNVPDGARPVDYFVKARLRNEGLSGTPAASRPKLLRRVTLDLTGLPPTLAELDAFLADDSPGGYEKAVDRLLASEAYGQRMAWDWLDAARYADSNGFQGDRDRTMWPWRDWVVQSLNTNMPYDQFTIWQLAGDQLPGATPQQKLATGFCRNHMINGEGGRIAEENRIEYIFDQTETLGTIWLGLTLTCCRCHDHKYDPLAQREYYQLFAFFNQTPVDGSGGDPQTAPVISAPLPGQLRQIDALEAQITASQQELTRQKAELALQQQEWEQKMLAADVISTRWTVLPPDSASARYQTLEILPDDSVLASGPNPNDDTYTVKAPVDLEAITGVRLEALQHESLTPNGLSRAKSGNFVLSEFELQLQRTDETQPVPIELASADATFEQDGWKVTAAFDGKPKTGWGVSEDRPVDREHAALFRFATRQTAGLGSKLIFTLSHESDNINHNLGRFRLSATADPHPELAASRQALVEALGVPSEERSKEQAQSITERFFATDENFVRLQLDLRLAKQELEELRASIAEVMIMQDMETPRETFLLTKGLYNQPKDQVTAEVPQILPPLPEDAPANRLTLARWLVDRSHPLTSRVVVNRHWQKFFGHGLVKTTEDFGSQGEKPSYPRLLDWLAAEFVESGWNVKALHKQIVMSATYQQTAKAPAELYQRDPDNRLLARGPRSRLASWMLRDQALAVSGLLVHKMGGPPVNPYQPAGVWSDATFGKKQYEQDQGENLYNRSIYTFWRRIIGPTMFFDVSKRQTCTVKTAQTNTPLHALATLNDTTYVEAARALAERVMHRHNEVADRLGMAFRLCTSRRPTAAELDLLVARLEVFRKQYAATPGEATKLLKVGQSQRDENLDPVEHAAHTGACLLVLNLDEALNK
jgi:hypothetical protein